MVRKKLLTIREEFENLTDEKINKGMDVLREWVRNHQRKDEDLVIAGDKEDHWSPSEILKVLEKRQEKNELGDVGDLPESILISATKGNRNEKDKPI